MKVPTTPPTWPQLIALLTLFSAGSGIAGNRIANADTPISPAQMQQIQRGPDNTALIDTLNRLQLSVEQLNKTVQELSTKVAVLEDRGRRERR